MDAAAGCNSAVAAWCVFTLSRLGMSWYVAVERKTGKRRITVNARTARLCHTGADRGYSTLSSPATLTSLATLASGAALFTAHSTGTAADFDVAFLASIRY